jgi:TonB family protein
MEIVMQDRLTSSKAKFLFPLAVFSAGVVSPAAANWFIGQNVGSAASPTPQDIRGSEPYPLQSQMLNEQGKVGLKVWLTKEGAITDVVVERTSGFPRLDDAAVRYVKTFWRYEPSENDKAMPETTLAEVTFKLE